MDTETAIIISTVFLRVSCHEGCRMSHKQLNIIFIKFFNFLAGSCDSVRCDEGKRCVLDQNGLPHCIYCSDTCRTPHGTRRMLCGADGVTYPSSCHLFKATCDKGRSVMLAYKGRCIGACLCSLPRKTINEWKKVSTYYVNAIAV